MICSQSVLQKRSKRLCGMMLIDKSYRLARACEVLECSEMVKC